MMKRESCYISSLCFIIKANKGAQISVLEFQVGLLLLFSAYLAVLIGLGSKFP